MYKNGIELMYFMRGALSKEEMMDLVPFEKEIISEFINERLEIEAKKRHPIY
jgi:hypothetical protein